MVVRLLLLAGLVGLGWSFVSFGSRRTRISTSNETARKALETDLADYDYKNSVKLPWLEGGYNNWTYKGMKVNYIDVGKEDGKEKPNLLLIHGFGASAYHWRYNIPVLARDYRVFAIDMLGFGLSEKPIMDYTAELWRDQTLAFLEEVVERDSHKPTVVCGNSLGGFTALYAAADETRASKLINGCILVNAAGRFKSGLDETKKEDPVWLSSVKGALQRFVIGLSFVYTKQPARINQVLRQVYPVNPARVDDELVESIRFPAQDPNAAEVFYRVIKKNGNGPPVFVDDLLQTLKVPLLLLWGTQDPWIRPKSADNIKALFPAATRVDVNGGHCPHDECPDEVNLAISNFMAEL